MQTNSSSDCRRAVAHSLYCGHQFLHQRIAKQCIRKPESENDSLRRKYNLITDSVSVLRRCVTAGYVIIIIINSSSSSSGRQHATHATLRTSLLYTALAHQPRPSRRLWHAMIARACLRSRHFGSWLCSQLLREKNIQSEENFTQQSKQIYCS